MAESTTFAEFHKDDKNSDKGGPTQAQQEQLTHRPLPQEEHAKNSSRGR